MAHFDWVERVRILEMENQRLMTCQEDTLKDTNRKLLQYLNEVHNLRNEMERLRKENAELKELCCYLDDERRRSKKCAADWQNFGHYTANVMKQEVTAYQEQLKILDARQNDLIGENRYLRERLVHIGQDSSDGRNFASVEESRNSTPSTSSASPRYCGDGSSESETALNVQKVEFDQADDLCDSTNTILYRPDHNDHCSGKSLASELSLSSSTATSSASVIDCIRNIESRVRKLEENKLAAAMFMMMQTSMSAPELARVCNVDETRVPSSSSLPLQAKRPCEKPPATQDCETRYLRCYDKSNVHGLSDFTVCDTRNVPLFANVDSGDRYAA